MGGNRWWRSCGCRGAHTDGAEELKTIQEASVSTPPISDVPTLAAKAQIHTTDDGTVLLAHRPPMPSLSVADHATPIDLSARVYVPVFMRPWVLHTCHTTTSYPLWVTRTLIMIMRFVWWISMRISTLWWFRRCVKHRVRKTSRQAIRWPTLCLPLPNSPSILVSVDYFGLLPTHHTKGQGLRPLLHRPFQPPRRHVRHNRPSGGGKGESRQRNRMAAEQNNSARCSRPQSIWV